MTDNPYDQFDNVAPEVNPYDQFDDKGILASTTDKAKNYFDEMGNTIIGGGARAAGTLAYPFLSEENKQKLIDKGMLGDLPELSGNEGHDEIAKGLTRANALLSPAMGALYTLPAAPIAPLLNPAIEAAPQVAQKVGLSEENSSLVKPSIELAMNLAGLGGLHYTKGLNGEVLPPEVTPNEPSFTSPPAPDAPIIVGNAPQITGDVTAPTSPPEPPATPPEPPVTPPTKYEPDYHFDTDTYGVKEAGTDNFIQTGFDREEEAAEAADALNNPASAPQNATNVNGVSENSINPVTPETPTSNPFRDYMTQKGFSPDEIDKMEKMRNMPAQEPAPVVQPPVDITPAGNQTVMQGMEKISDKALAERQMNQPLRPNLPQQPANEGLFDLGARKQQDLFANQPAKEVPTPVQKAPITPPNDSNGKPTSLYTFITKNGGKVDENGQIASFKTPEGKVLQGHNAADYVGELASQHGYFNERPSGIDLQNTLAETNGGRNHFRDVDVPRLLNAKANNVSTLNNDPAYIEHLANQYGVDTTGKSLSQIKAGTLQAMRSDIPHTNEEFANHAVNYPQNPEGMHQAARDLVLSKHAADGNEHGIMVDNETGEVHHIDTSGNKNDIILSSASHEAALNPYNNATFHHSHPEYATLSDKDILNMGISHGIKEVVAHRPDSASSARLSNFMRDNLSFSGLRDVVSLSRSSILDDMLKLRDNGLKDASQVWNEAANKGLEKAGIIEYKSSNPIIEQHQDLINRMADKVANAIQEKGIYNDEGYTEKHNTVPLVRGATNPIRSETGLAEMVKENAGNKATNLADRRGNQTSPQVSGNGKSVLRFNNPNNLPTVKTDTPAFKKWFGDSKVIDKEGKPLVVYHGTGSDISEFKFDFTGKGNDQLGSGFYFTTSPDEASNYTTNTIAGKEKLGEIDSPNVIPSYLNIRNPLDAEKVGNITRTQVKKILEKSPVLDDKLQDWGDIEYEGRDKVLNEAINSYIVEKGNILKGLHKIANDFFPDNIKEFNGAVRDILKYDGIVDDFGMKTHYVAFFPEQIKSIFNKGTFDPESSLIFESPRDLDLYKSASTTMKNLWRDETGAVHSTVFKEIRNTISPTMAGEGALKTAQEIRKAYGLASRERIKDETNLNDYARQATKMDDADRHDFYNYVEGRSKGVELRNPALQGMADAVKQVYERMRGRLEAMPETRMMNFIQDYFTHQWKNKEAAQKFINDFIAQQGSNRALKQRVLPTIADGLAHGLELEEPNPIRAVSRYLGSMNNYIASVDTLRAIKGLDSKYYVKGMQPEDFEPLVGRNAERIENAKIDQKSGKIIPARNMQLYAPSDVARIYNRFYSKGFEATGLKSTYEVARGAINANTLMELGLSAYHAQTITIQALAQDVTRFAKNAIMGDWKGVGLAMKKLAPLSYYRQGKVLAQQYKGLADHGIDMEQLADHFAKGNLRLGNDPLSQMGHGSWFSSYSRGELPEIIDHLKQQMKTGYGLGILKSAAETVGKTVSTVSAPLFEHYIPAVKMSAFADLMGDWLRQNPKASDAEVALERMKIANHIDSRFGEANMENVFLPKLAKQMLGLGLRAPGWDKGLIDQVLGPVKDIYSMAASVAKGKKVNPSLLDRPLYMASSLFVYGALASAMTWALTGITPPSQKIMDFIAYRTGKYKKSYGDTVQERGQLPGHGREITNLYPEPGKNMFSGLYDEIVNKRSTLLSSIVNVADPKIEKGKQVDEHGNVIYDPKSKDFFTGTPGVAQAAYIAKGYLPITVKDNRIFQPNESFLANNNPLFKIGTPAGARIINRKGLEDYNRSHQ